MSLKSNYIQAFAGLIVFTIAACTKLLPNAPKENEALDGPMTGLSPAEHARFLAGDRAFNDEVFTKETGLGPYFVATSCGSCHAGDGKGHPFSTLIRFGQDAPGENTYLEFGGPQLQNRAIIGYTPEVLPEGATYSKFTPPANTGLGLLAALTDAQILANADPNDLNQDGIKGVPNFVQAPSYFVPQWIHQNFAGKYIGRFGKKAAAIDLIHQTVNAYNQDMGITSHFAPVEPGINGLGPGIPSDPEVSNKTILDVVFYLRTLKAPLPRNQSAPDVIAGKQLFSQIGCASCHIPEWTTPKSDIAALSNVTFYPYTDLLLHDMGTQLDDRYTEGSATSAQWKTPALWGLGLSKKSQGGRYFLMHDGRAQSIEEAILLHGGEASTSVSNYSNTLTEKQKQQLIKFLESL